MLGQRIINRLMLTFSCCLVTTYYMFTFLLLHHLVCIRVYAVEEEKQEPVNFGSYIGKGNLSKEGSGRGS